jgi:hypothetical protein
MEKNIKIQILPIIVLSKYFLLTVTNPINFSFMSLSELKTDGIYSAAC